MSTVLKSDKRARALVFAACIAALSVVLGLYLILVQDTRTKASWSASVGSLYFMQSSKQGFNGSGADYFLDKAYIAHMQAVHILPYDPNLWVRLSYVLMAKDTEPEAALKALDIAALLSPSSMEELNTHREKILEHYDGPIK